jgi:hypothetical protein
LVGEAGKVGWGVQGITRGRGFCRKKLRGVCGGCVVWRILEGHIVFSLEQLIPDTAYNKKVCYSMFSPFLHQLAFFLGFDNNFYFLETTCSFGSLFSLVCLWVIGVWTGGVCFESRGNHQSVGLFNLSANRLSEESFQIQGSSECWAEARGHHHVLMMQGSDIIIFICSAHQC